MNAIIGDNGIITRAQEAAVLQNCAVLEEYLKEDYVGNIKIDETVNGGDSVELTPLEEMIKFRNNYFFKNGSYDYVIYEYNHDGKTDFLKVRLINKNNLKDDIKKQLKGGDADGNKREAYLEFKDVYGVTEDLEVFYCEDGLLSAIGASYLNSSLFDSTRVLYSKESPVSKALAESTGMADSKDLTISDLRSTTELTVSGESGVTDLNFLVDMPRVSKLTIKNYKGKLSGIDYLEGLTYLYFDNSGGTTDINYEGLSGALNLKELYFLMPNDIEIEKMCTEMSKSDYGRLKILNVSGYIESPNLNQFITKLSLSNSLRDERSNLTTLESLNLLTKNTKENVDSLFVNNNRLTSLEGIQDFKNIKSLYFSNNRFLLSDGNTDTTKSLVIGQTLTNMTKLQNLFCSFDNIQNDDFKNISKNTSIEYLSIAANPLIKDLDVLITLINLKGLQARHNSNYILDDNSLIQKISKLGEKYLDDKYATKLALANIEEEVWLGSDATNEDIDILLSKNDEELNKILFFEIPGNKEITDEKLQVLLGKLSNMVGLCADYSQLSSFNFIKEKNEKIKYISVLNTNINNLTQLSNCTKLRALRINTKGLDLKPFSKLISDICARGLPDESINYVCGSVTGRGLCTTGEILKTLNGTPKQINEEFKYFNDYGPLSTRTENEEIDFSYTNLIEMRGIIYDFKTFILPSCFDRFDCKECAGAVLDYSNLSSASYYNADQVSSRNYANFTGYETIFTSALDPVSIVGSNTKSLTLGISNRNSKRTPSNQYRIAEIVDKGTNIENMTIWGASGFSDISILSSLNLKSLEICYSSLYGLKTGGASFENMANNLTTLTISDCSSFNSLDGLDKLTHITNLDLSNNSSLEDIQTITKSDGSKESKNTCQYIVESLPSLEKVTLSGCGLKNFSYLTSHGFKETSNGSRVFTKSN